MSKMGVTDFNLREATGFCRGLINAFGKTRIRATDGPSAIAYILLLRGEVSGPLPGNPTSTLYRSKSLDFGFWGFVSLFNMAYDLALWLLQDAPAGPWASSASTHWSHIAEAKSSRHCLSSPFLSI
jgi:hypothetical protein